MHLASLYARSLIEASLDPLVTINADGKITDVNNASVEVTGVVREQLVGTDFSNYFTALSKDVTATNLADAKKQGAVLAWGNFLTLTLNFMIVAFVLFMVIRGMNRLKREEPKAEPEAPKLTADQVLLTEIRDLLKSQEVEISGVSDIAVHRDVGEMTKTTYDLLEKPPRQ